MRKTLVASQPGDSAPPRTSSEQRAPQNRAHARNTIQSARQSVLYYGDEIGMGDNIYLGDRNGVRTPMQWSADRNAGFSRADFAQLYLPVIMDSVYGYEGVNVEAQKKNPTSLLHWVRQLIALRQRHPAFGRGSLEIIRSENRRIFAFTRTYKDEILLCAFNLARSSQPAELDLRRYQGLTPFDMQYQVRFPTIGEKGYP
jgi:maltose alpha-D-glucosyltransferase/alpha-amylase